MYNNLKWVLFSIVLSCAPHTNNYNYDNNIIEAYEITNYHQNAYQIIKQLRPFWLDTRQYGMRSSGYPEILISGGRVFFEELQNINAREILRIEKYRESEAYIKFGVRNHSGAINILVYYGK